MREAARRAQSHLIGSNPSFCAHEKSSLKNIAFRELKSHWRRRRNSRVLLCGTLLPSLASSVGRNAENTACRVFPTRFHLIGSNPSLSLRTKKAPLEAVAFKGDVRSGGGGGIRTLVTRVTRKTVFETAAFNHSATPPHGVRPLGFQGRARIRFEKGHVAVALSILAERWGFEPQIRFWRIHDFQSCSFGQLGHLSASPSCAPSSDEAAAK